MGWECSCSAGDVFPTDGDPWLSGEGDGEQGMDPQLSRQQRRCSLFSL